MTLRRYERYKDSGVEWLGAVPAHWVVLQLRRVIDRIEQGWSPECESRPADEGEWGVLKTGCVNGGRFNPLENKALPSQLEAPPELEVARNDLLMSRASGSQELVGSAALVNDTPPRLLLSDKTFRLHVNQRVDKQFLAWCLGSRLLRAQIECAISGAAGLANNLPQASLVEFVSPFPPVHEQRGIAAYLNRETTKIDELVVEQQRLIELLSEKRRAIVAHAVTKGLNPAAPMKDSGVHWLGKVPTHWNVYQLRRAMERVEQGWSPQCENRPAEDGEWAVLKSGCVNGGRFNPRESKALPNHMEVPRGLEVSPNDLLMSRASGSPDLVGAVALVGQTPSKLLLSDKTLRLHVNERADKKFLTWCLGSRPLRAQIECAISGAAGLANNLPQSSLVEFIAAFPPPTEQRRIASFLDRESAKIEGLIDEARCAIHLLRERRNALISAAVTGQIDVRDSASVESALAETHADIAAGRYVVESAATHVARVQAMAAADEHSPSPPHSC